MLTREFFIVSNMINKFSGQPDSYDKKCVNLPPFSCRLYSRIGQIQVSIWQDIGCRDIRHRQGSRMRWGEICYQDYSQKERQRQREDGVR